MSLSRAALAALGGLGGLATLATGMAGTEGADKAPQTPSAQVDALFAQWNTSSSPGCSVAVMQGGQITYERGYGMADLDHGIANTPTTVYHVASVSKQFAAAAIVLLAQDGKLSLDDDVRKHIPELANFGKPITIRQLVHHTSGLRDQWELLGFSGWRYSLDLITDEDVMSLLVRQKALNFPPNSQYSYSNSGYTLLGQIVKRVSGKSLREFTTERMFRPLGMRNTHFRDDHAEIVPNIAYGYEKPGDAFKLSVTNFDTVGATSLLTNVEDLARWDENFYTGQVGGAPFLKQMVEQGVLNDGKQIEYAFGLVIGSYRGLPFVDHSGSDAGYRSYLGRFPQQHFSVAVLCNYSETSTRELGRKIAEIYLGSQMQPVPVSEERFVEVPQSQLQALTGTYVRKDGRMAEQVVLRDGKFGLLSTYDDSVTPLKPLTEKRFRGDRRDIVEFDGRRLTLTPEARDSEVYQRVAFTQPTAQQLERYTGTYLSPEIELPYRVKVEQGRLMVSNMKLKGQALTPVAPDLFDAGDIGTVRFTRSGGRIDGFVINTRRIVDFRFDAQRR